MEYNKRMDVLTFLKSIRAERADLIKRQEDWAQLRSVLLPGGIDTSKPNVQTSPSDKMADIESQLIDMEREQQDYYIHLQSDVRAALDLIDSLENADHRRLLYLRYISGGSKPPTWSQIADELGYSVDHTRGRMHGDAVQEARKHWKS